MSHSSPQELARDVALALSGYRDGFEVTNRTIRDRLAEAGTPMSEATISRIMRGTQYPTIFQLACITSVLGINLREVI